MRNLFPTDRTLRIPDDDKTWPLPPGLGRFPIIHVDDFAATAVRELSCPVSEIFDKEGIAGLEKILGVGETIARSIREMLLHGKLAMLERLRGEHDPLALLQSVPGIGKIAAWKLALCDVTLAKFRVSSTRAPFREYCAEVAALIREFNLSISLTKPRQRSYAVRKR